MAKYRITEAQLQKVFESLETRKISEMDNYNYPMGADTPDAPWNRDSKMSNPISAGGDFKAVGNTIDEYLLVNSKTGQLLYSNDEAWESQNGSSWTDIADELEDYLEIPQEDDYDDEYGKKISRNAEDWKFHFDGNDYINAMVSYVNNKVKSGKDLQIVDLDGWESGMGHFLMVTPESISEIQDGGLRQQAAKMLGA